MTTLCLHCDAALTAKDLRDGWCDNCGKKVPSGLVAQPRAVAACATVQAMDGEPPAVWKSVLAILLVIASSYFLTITLLSDRSSLTAMLKIANGTLVILFLALPVFLSPVPRTR